MTMYEEADALLHECGLLAVLEQYGTVSVTGSYSMDMMAWRDLDLYIEENDALLGRWFELVYGVCACLNPVWFDGLHKPGVLFFGCETEMDGERWNIDIWAKDRETIQSSEAYCESIRRRAEEDPAARRAILEIKTALIEHGLYGLGKSPTRHYHSGDIYTAVLEEGVRTVQEFLEKHPK